MHIAQVGFVKGRNVATTIARNTSCNSGWLRLVVQTIFGTLIVSSFILILLMVVGKPSRSGGHNSRCTITNCRVTCTNAPYYGNYEDDILNAASEADTQCKGIVLKLIGPTFKNFKIPPNWLWRMISNIRELNIVGGNIKHIENDAFMSPFGGNIRILSLEEIEINVWESDTLVGLSNLETLLLTDVVLTDVKKNALAPVDDSLKFLNIKASNTWEPVNITGTTRLTQLNVVDFSANTFPSNNLRNGSFFKLRACKMLYLSSCNLETIEAGVFDYLENIEFLYLNDNSLITVPFGLFDRIVPREPKLTLHDNLWNCDCSREDLRNIARKELLVVDPICHSPEKLWGMTFSDFEGFCQTKHSEDVENSLQRGIHRSDIIINDTSQIIYMNGACHGNLSSNVNTDRDSLQIITMFGHQSCLLNRINEHDVKSLSPKNNNASSSVKWIKPVFFVQIRPYSMVEIISSAFPGYGLLWYQSSCENIVYCVNTVPRLLKVFNVDLGNHLTFCPFNLSSGTVSSMYCVSYNLANAQANNKAYSTFETHELIWLICLSLGCLICGAICVYGVIQRNPTLLRGSKRVLFVKHRSIEALILPPKLPMRKFDNDPNITRHIYEENNIYVLPSKQDTLTYQTFSRSFSMKSNASNEVSYISALQPTEEELNEWRSKQMLKQFDRKPSSNISMIPYTSIHERESLPYYSFNNDETIYQVPKQS